MKNIGSTKPSHLHLWITDPEPTRYSSREETHERTAALEPDRAGRGMG